MSSSQLQSLLLLLMLFARGNFESLTDTNDTNYRLPITVLPVHYKIRLVPYFEERNFTFDGEVEITANATVDTNIITLHFDNITVTEDPTVTSVNGLENLQVVSSTYDNETHLYQLILEKNLQINQLYRIYIKYTGNLQEDVSGVYRCSYSTHNETRWIATTYFEPAYARKAFPSFDEPGLKARFQINIARTAQYHAVSNMPKETTSEPDPNIDGRVWDHFQETPPMSTYLVAFLLSDFKNFSTADGKYNIWVKEDFLQHANYASYITPIIVKFMENYTGINYTLPKLDFIADPCFPSAMENWGLADYQEWSILLRNQSSNIMKQTFQFIHAHEISHMWFGNLITPKWWNELWLKEGFARYFEYVIISELEPDWHIRDLFVVNVLQLALFVDANSYAHPVNKDTGNPTKPDDIHLAIVYGKGACIIRMMEHFLTEETFKNGLRIFLSTHVYDNVGKDDLFQALNDQQKKENILPKNLDVKTIMDTWTSQESFPIIEVLRKTDRIQLHQKKFKLNEMEDTSENTTWWIPISYTMNTNLDFTDTKPRTWLENQSCLTLNENISDSHWIIFNIQATSFYRVKYDLRSWMLITEFLKTPQYKNIHVLNRAQLLDDAFFLASSLMLNYTTALELSTYLIEETDYIPWASYFVIISQLDNMLNGTSIYPSFRNYVIILMEKIFNFVQTQYNEDDYLMEMSQLNVLYWACYFGYEECVKWVVSAFSNWLQNPETNMISEHLKAVVYCTVLTYSDHENLENIVVSVPKLMSEMLKEVLHITEYFNCTSEDSHVFTTFSYLYDAEKSTFISSLRSNLRARNITPFKKWINNTVFYNTNEEWYDNTTYDFGDNTYCSLGNANSSKCQIFQDISNWLQSFERRQHV